VGAATNRKYSKCEDLYPSDASYIVKIASPLDMIVKKILIPNTQSKKPLLSVDNL